MGASDWQGPNLQSGFFATPDGSRTASERFIAVLFHSLHAARSWSGTECSSNVPKLCCRCFVCMHHLLQLYYAPKAAAKALPETTTLVPLGTVPGWVQGANNKLPASQVTARQFEIQAAFSLSRSAGSGNGTAGSSTQAGLRDTFKLQAPGDFAVGVRLDFGSSQYADVYLRGTVEGGTSELTNLSLWFDRSQAGTQTNTSWIEGGPVPLPVDASKAWRVSQEPLRLSVWVDHGVVEIFGMQGLGRLTSRVYPEGDGIAWGASAWVIPPESGGWGAELDAQAWEVLSAWLPPSC